MSDKIKLNVTMKYKADSYKQANNLCIVEEIVPIPDADFLELATFPCRDNPYIALHKGSMFADSEAMHCVLFIAEKQGDGFLVESEGYDYARYSQYIPHAGDIVAGQQRRLSEVSEKLYAALEKNLDFLAAESRAEPNYRIPIDAVFDTPEIDECLLELAGELLKEQTEFADIRLSCNDRIITIEGDKYDTLRFISPLRVDTDLLVTLAPVEPEKVLEYATFINNELDADIELKEYKPDYEIYDYASAHGLTFPLQEQADVYNAAYAFAEHSPINEENQDREGFFTVSGVRTYGRLTGYTFDSYDTYRRTIFTPVGIYNVRAYEYGKNGELFWNMGERGVPGYETQYKIIYSDDEQVIVRLDAQFDEMFANVKNTHEVNYTILLLTEDGWRVDLLRDPQLF